MTQWFGTSVLILSLLGQPSPTEEPDVATIQKSIDELAHSSFRVRQDAMKRLWSIGEAAEPALKKALNSHDREVRARAEWVLDRVQLGITPDSPRDILGALVRFREGSITEKQAVLQELAKLKKFRILFRFILSIEDATVREQLSRPFWSQFDRLASGLLEEGNYDEYEDTLKWGVQTDSSNRGSGVRIRQLVAFWHLRGKLDDELTATKKREDIATDRRAQHLVAYAHYVKGDFNEALEWATKAGETDLASDIHLRQRNWAKLIELGDIGRDGIESLGFRAAFYRKLGDRKNFEAALKEIEKMADASTSQRWFCGEALLVNGEPERAIELFKKSDPPKIAFQLLCYQGRFKEAFELVGLNDFDNPETWFRDLLAKHTEAADQRKKVHPMAIEVGRRLFNLNQTGAAEKLFDAIANNCSTKEGANELRALAKMEMTLGLDDRALNHGAKAIELEPERTNSVIWSLHSKTYQSAWSWWKFIEQKSPKSTHLERLEKLHELYYPEDRKATIAELPKRTDEALEYVQRQPAEQQGTMLRAIADLCKHYEETRLTEKLLLLLAEKQPDAKVWMELGHLYGNLERWREAAEMYRASWNADKLKPSALYLEGHALAKLGAANGENLQTLAKLIPLANAEQRRGMANDLDEAGLDEATVEQWRAILQFGSPPALTGEFAWTVSYANRQIGNAISDEEPAEAADHWERWLIYLLRTQSSFTEPHHYLTIPHLIAKSRAKGFIKEKEFDKALAQGKLSQRYVPLEVNLPIELVPLLDKAGETDAADELFQTSYQVHLNILTDFPDSPLHLNNAAWLAANCDRKLDEALKHSKKANELAPDRASYIDTLAEVYFRRGDRENAIKYAKRCIELDPENDFYPEQLERFSKDSS